MAAHQARSSASISSQSAIPELNGALFSPMTLLLVSLGTIGGLLFAAIYLIEGFTRPGYDLIQHSISLLSLGPGGWVQQVNFVVFGLLTLCSALGWRQALAPGIGTLWYPILRGLEGLGLIVDGFFSQDPADGYPPGAHAATVSGHATIHVLFAFLAITAIAIGEFVLARRFASEPRWRGWTIPAVVTGVFTIIFIAIFGSLSAHIGTPAGIFERLATGINSLFGLAILIRLWLDRQQKQVKAV